MIQFALHSRPIFIIIMNFLRQISDINHPLPLVIHLESNGNPSLRETVRDPNGQIISDLRIH